MEFWVSFVDKDLSEDGCNRNVQVLCGEFVECCLLDEVAEFSAYFCVKDV